MAKPTCTHQEGYEVHLQEGTRYVKFTFCPWCAMRMSDLHHPEPVEDDCQKGGCED
jgi:hypothetical protein